MNLIVLINLFLDGLNKHYGRLRVFSVDLSPRTHNGLINSVNDRKMRGGSNFELRK